MARKVKIPKIGGKTMEGLAKNISNGIEKIFKR